MQNEKINNMNIMKSTRYIQKEGNECRNHYSRIYDCCPSPNVLTPYCDNAVEADCSAREPIIEYIVQFQSTHERQRVYDSFTRTKFTYVLKFKYFFIPSFTLY